MGTKTLTDMSLEELYDRGTELRKGLAEFPESERTDDQKREIRALIDEVGELDAAITLSELEQRRSDQSITANQGGFRNVHGHDVRSIADVLMDEGSGFMDWVVRDGPTGRGNHGFDMSFSDRGSAAEMGLRAEFDAFNTGGLLTRATVTEWASGGPPTYDSTGTGNLLPVGQPIAPIPRQARLYLRDLIPTMTTTLAQIPYVQELNPTNYESASSVAEGGTKPTATLSFQGAKADPTVIAATLVISKQLFEDAAAVVQYINTRLPYLVKFKEDNEFLNGSGTWPDITGILQTSGVQTQSLATDNVTTFGNAFAKVENHDGTPTAVVLNPFNAWQMFTNRASTSGVLDAGTPFSALPLTVWGVPTYRTRAITEDSALVGDFQLGAMIADREEVNVETYRERYAEQNAILLVCEERVGLMVFRPDLFVNVSSLAHI
jgi:hypothetical protein